MTTTKRILLTPGEPAGIGPDVVVQIAQASCAAELIVIADPELLLQRAAQLKLPLTLHTADLAAPPTAHAPASLKIIPLTLAAKAQVGELNPQNAAYVLDTLRRAAQLCLHKTADAIVTGPVHKGVINQAGIHFTGHTEFFAAEAYVPQTVMLFVLDAMKVALATTHMPLAQVPQAITKAHLRAVLTILNTDLKKYFHLTAPRILICGLNPHAGENGYLGREEINIIAPLISDMRAEGYMLEGPLAADTIFTAQQLRRGDAILAMYHDQALPVVKQMGFDRAVNVTLGLPFIRTSVDHGTALELAGSGKADARSMQAALDLAIHLVH